MDEANLTTSAEPTQETPLEATVAENAELLPSPEPQLELNTVSAASEGPSPEPGSGQGGPEGTDTVSLLEPLAMTLADIILTAEALDSLADAPPPRPRRCRVSLPHAGELELMAIDDQDAILQFNARCGVLSTAHKHDVIWLE